MRSPLTTSSRLAEDDFDAKSQALNQIIAAGDATALRVLEAMGTGKRRRHLRRTGA